MRGTDRHLVRAHPLPLIKPLFQETVGGDPPCGLREAMADHHCPLCGDGLGTPGDRARLLVLVTDVPLRFQTIGNTSGRTLSRIELVKW